MILAARHPRPIIADATCYGQLDIGLAEPVDASARQILHAVGRRPIDKVVTSPLRRAHDTAMHIARSMALPLVIEPRLMELDFGRWEGVAWRNISRKELDAWAASPMAYRPGGGEAVQDLYDRVAAVWRESSDLAVGQLWITHAGPLRCLTALATGIDFATCLTSSIAFCSVHDVTPRDPSVRCPGGN